LAQAHEVVRLQDVLAVEQDLAFAPRARSLVMHAVDRPQECRFAGARGADQRRDASFEDGQVDPVESAERVVEEAEVLDVDGRGEYEWIASNRYGCVEKH